MTFEHNENNRLLGFDKVIMLAGGIGFANSKHSKKLKIKEGDLIIVLGGDNYRIGMGGAAVSSTETGKYSSGIELNAVQRSNPEMQKRVSNVIRALQESSAEALGPGRTARKPSRRPGRPWVSRASLDLIKIFMHIFFSMYFNHELVRLSG